jgi:SAM-dependent methyltransferase
MDKNYDSTVQEHYQEVASQHGLSPTSTMEDERTRELETQAIMLFIEEAQQNLRQGKATGETTIMDVGCGNGYTLEAISKEYPAPTLVGIENSPALRELASSRFAGCSTVRIRGGDIRDAGFAQETVADILICQRVLINLLDGEDQRNAFHHIIDAVAPPTRGSRGGFLLFIEAFLGPLARLNVARAEFNLPPMAPAPYNRYLADDFFLTPRLAPLAADGFLPPPNFLSTHYFVTRVLHEIFSQNLPFKRNSEFVRFLSLALRQNVGDYSPLKLHMFRRVA